ncbi:outer membrane beta-barrel protein [Alteromonas sp. H39]|uniref:outer membrane beta-barrel protein n=1 Tax=Alteromonas sp. H39 TaxID=3389876 RepID=UPI0039E1B559
MKKAVVAIGLCLGILSLPVAAIEKMYGTFGVGYADTEFSQQTKDGITYNLAIGHQFMSQWYVELGYQQIVDEQEGAESMKADALYLAVLGKASSYNGELFYKLGVMNVDVAGVENMLGDGVCDVGDAVPELAQCRYDEGSLAGLIGLGYDYHLGMRSMLRLEYNYIGGENDLKAHIVNIGFRYNFN